MSASSLAPMERDEDLSLWVSALTSAAEWALWTAIRSATIPSDGSTKDCRISLNMASSAPSRSRTASRMEPTILLCIGLWYEAAVFTLNEIGRPI